MGHEGCQPDYLHTHDLHLEILPSRLAHRLANVEAGFAPGSLCFFCARQRLTVSKLRMLVCRLRGEVLTQGTCELL
jgi:hypothetical protein